MYQRVIKVCLHGDDSKYFPMFRSVPAPEDFTIQYTGDIAKADILITISDGLERASEIIEMLSEQKRADAELIALTYKPDELCSVYDKLGDIWTAPMSEEYFLFLAKNALRRRAEYMEHRQTEQYLDTLIDNMPSLVWYKTKDGLHEKVNNEFCRTVGKTKDDVRGKPHTYIWGVPEDDPACIESDNKAIQGGETVISEEHISTENGPRVLVSYKSPLYDFDGSVMGTVGCALDVTKERAFEEEILAKNKMFENMFASIDCGMMWHTLDGKEVLFINRTALRILGYETCDELMADGFNYVSKSVLDEDKGMLAEKIQSLKGLGDSVNVEYRVLHPDGEELHVLGNIKLISMNGKYLCQRYLLDITEQKEQSNEKQRHQSAMVEVLAANYSVVCYFDMEMDTGSLLHINDCPKNVLSKVFAGELKLEETIKRYCQTCVAEEDRERFLENCSRETLKRELSEKDSHFINYRVNCDKEEKYYQIKAVRVGSDKNHLNIVLGIRCVDEEIRTEMENKRLLEGALAQANRANKSKSVFLSNMSHDIRTPMNAIVGFTTLAMSRLDRPELIKDYLEKIMISGKHLLSLINDVLDMSRIENGKMHLEENPCTLPEVLHGVCNMIRPDIQKKQMDLKMDIANVRHENIVCDKLHLNQVLLNLLSNAIKYTPIGGTVALKTTETLSQNEGSAFYEFVISDNGIGMSEEFVHHIFEPFERERNTTASGIQGTGLGMAITKNIVDMMGGEIDVESEPDKGTTVTIKFEFKVLAQSTEHKELTDFRGQRALVVDDDFNTCDCVTGMLNELGMRAEWTLSGKEAVLRSKQAIERNDGYGVYIVDCFLPDLNGIELARRIRRETGGNVPVIIITAYDWTEFEEEAREAGISAFCSKPLFMSELKSCLENVAGGGAKKEEEIKTLLSGRILLVEDNELNREIGVTLLSDAGFDVDVAENGQIAVDMVEHSEPGYYNVILMDVQMPVMNGYEATKAIRRLENEQLRSIPILALTANAFEENKIEAISSGMNGHLAKPINVEELLVALKEIIEQKS